MKTPLRMAVEGLIASGVAWNLSSVSLPRITAHGVLSYHQWLVGSRVLIRTVVSCGHVDSVTYAPGPCAQEWLAESPKTRADLGNSRAYREDRAQRDRQRFVEWQAKLTKMRQVYDA